MQYIVFIACNHQEWSPAYLHVGVRHRTVQSEYDSCSKGPSLFRRRAPHRFPVELTFSCALENIWL